MRTMKRLEVRHTSLSQNSLSDDSTERHHGKTSVLQKGKADKCEKNAETKKLTDFITSHVP